MQDMQRQMLAQALMGQQNSGMGNQIAQYMPAYQQAMLQAEKTGQQIPSFPEWAAQFMGPMQQGGQQMPGGQLPGGQ